MMKIEINDNAIIVDDSITIQRTTNLVGNALIIDTLFNHDDTRIILNFLNHAEYHIVTIAEIKRAMFLDKT